MQPHSVVFSDYRIRMPHRDTRITLWENVLALMHREFGEENVTGFARWAKIGVGSVQRIREQKTSVGLEIIEKIARKAKLDPWQMLVPDLDVTNAPVLAKDADKARILIDNLRSSRDALTRLLPPDTEPGRLDGPNIVVLPGAAVPPTNPGLQRTSTQKRKPHHPKKKESK